MNNNHELRKTAKIYRKTFREKLPESEIAIDKINSVPSTNINMRPKEITT